MNCKRNRTAILAVAFVSLALAGDSGVELPSKTFTYEAAGAPLATVLGEFAKQTGVTIGQSRPNENRSVNVQCKNTPFWNALEQIARQSNHRLVFNDGGRSIQLEAVNGDTAHQVPICIDRVFRVCARRVQSNVDLETGAAKTVVTLGLNWEPGFSVFLVELPSQSIKALDNDKRRLTVAETGRGRFAASDAQIDLPVSFSDVPRSAQRIGQMEGTIGIIGASKMFDFEFANLSESKEWREQSQHGVTVRVSTDLAENSKLWTVRVELAYPEGGPKLDSHEATCWLANNSTWLASADGKTKSEFNGGYELTSADSRRAALVYRFVNEAGHRLGKPADWSLHIRSPSRLISTEVQVKLENIALP